MNERDSGRPKSRKVVAGVSASLSLLMGGLLLAEHGASARTLSRPRSADRVVLPAPSPVAAPAVARLLPANPTLVDALAAGRQIANQADAPQPVVANQTAADDLSCPILLANRAFIVSNFSFLGSTFPTNGPRLIADRDAALADINTRLAAAGCVVPSG